MTPGWLLLIAGVGLAAGISRLQISARLARGHAGRRSRGVRGGGVDAGHRQQVWDWQPDFVIGGEQLHLRLDGISAFFLILLSVLGGAGTLYSSEYWSDKNHPASAPPGRAWWNGLLLNMGLVLLCANGLHFLIAWELFTVCAYFLITLERQRREARAAGWLYFAASHVATLCLFAFFALLAARTGSWELGPMREHPGLAPLFWLALVGFGMKAGFFPLHIWLPSAHANAPSHVSAIMSGVAIKMGIYGIVRFSGWLPVPDSAGWVVAALGVVSAVLGVAFAFGQHDFKRLLAYHSVENIGIILIGLGFAMIAVSHGNAAWGRLALAGALLHVWNHGLFKSLLFFGAGSVLHATGTREMSRLGGLWRAMPWTAGLFALGAMAIAGLPPLNGFVSEWLVYLGLFDAVSAHGAAVVRRDSRRHRARHDRRAGAGVFRKSLRRGFPRPAAHGNCGTRARMRLADAPADARARRGVRRHRPRADFILAGDCNGGIRVATGACKCECFAVRAAGRARRVSSRAGRAGDFGRGIFVATRETKRREPRRNVGLRLRRADGADAIHRRFVRRHHHRLVRLDFATATARAFAQRKFSSARRFRRAHAGNGFGKCR